MNFLMQHRIRNRFGTVAIFIGRRRFPLVRGNVSSWCLLVVVVEEVAVLKYGVPFETMYGSMTVIAPAWMTEASELVPGVKVDRVETTGDEANIKQIGW